MWTVAALPQMVVVSQARDAVSMFLAARPIAARG
jgi:hypothetical protein